MTRCINELHPTMVKSTKYSSNISRAVVCTSNKDPKKMSWLSWTVLHVLSFSDISIECCMYYPFLIVCCILHIIMLHFSELQKASSNYYNALPVALGGGAFYYLVVQCCIGSCSFVIVHCITWCIALLGRLHLLDGLHWLVWMHFRPVALLDGLHYLVHWPVQEWGSRLPTVRRATTSTLLPGQIPTIHISCQSTISSTDDCDTNHSDNDDCDTNHPY